MNPNLLKNITITQQGDNLIINQKLFNTRYAFLLIIAIILLLIPIVLLSTTSLGVAAPFICTLIPLEVGLIALAIVTYINHKIIIISPTILSVTCKPIPCFNNINIKRDKILQLFIKETVNTDKNNRKRYYYSLYIISSDEQEIALIKASKNPELLRYLETYIEEYLDIENVAFSTEYKTGREAWQKIRDKNQAFKTTISNISYLQQTQQQNMLKATGNYKKYHLTVQVLPQLVSSIILKAITPPSIQKKLTLQQLETLFSTTSPQSSLAGTVKISKNGLFIRYIAQTIITTSTHLESLFSRLSTILEQYTHIITLGGEVVPILHPISQQADHPFQSVALHLLQTISQQTTARFELNPQDWLCSNCLNQYIAYKITIKNGHTLGYYACKNCAKSNTAHKRPKQVVLLLDNTTSQKYFEADDILYINWFQYRTIFDFDAVKIIAATDEDIERLAIQVGNDTDPTRKERYKQLPYTIDPNCTLSENSLKLLNRSFYYN